MAVPYSTYPASHMDLFDMLCWTLFTHRAQAIYLGIYLGILLPSSTGPSSQQVWNHNGSLTGPQALWTRAASAGVELPSTIPQLFEVNDSKVNQLPNHATPLTLV